MNQIKARPSHLLVLEKNPKVLTGLFSASLSLGLITRLRRSETEAAHTLFPLWFCAASLFGQGVDGMPRSSHRRIM